MTRRIAVLGLGRMGFAMASRLVDAGFRVSVYNRTRSKADALASRGAVVTATPREAAEGAEAVLCMVGDDVASRRMWTGPDGALAAAWAGSGWAIECSTISHRWMHELARLAAEKGVGYVDCPVTGLPAAAAAGRLTLFVGAEPAALDALADIFRHLAEDVIHFGPVGAANAYKLMVNLIGSCQIAALAEGLVLAERAGLDLDVVADALAKGAAASPQVVRNARRMVDGRHDEEVTFSAALRRKDTRYGLRLALELGVEARSGRAASRQFDDVVRSGWGGQNESKIIDVVRGVYVSRREPSRGSS